MSHNKIFDEIYGPGSPGWRGWGLKVAPPVFTPHLIERGTRILQPIILYIVLLRSRLVSREFRRIVSRTWLRMHDSRWETRIISDIKARMVPWWVLILHFWHVNGQEDCRKHHLLSSLSIFSTLFPWGNLICVVISKDL